MTESKTKILCIEDDADTCDLLTFVFTDAGYEIESCRLTDCLKLIHEERFAAIILDNHFHGVSGIDICRRIRTVDQTIPVILLSGEVRPAEIEKAMAAGANAYLTKPNDFEKLVALTAELIEQSAQSPAPAKPYTHS